VVVVETPGRSVEVMRVVVAVVEVSVGHGPSQDLKASRKYVVVWRLKLEMTWISMDPGAEMPREVPRSGRPETRTESGPRASRSTRNQSLRLKT